MDLTHLGVGAFLAGVLSLERKAFLQAMFSRPLVAGALIGLSFDRALEGLAIGATLELFHLGAVNLGAALPDNELFTTVAAASCACALAPRVELALPATLGLAALVALPAAKLGKVTDRLSERLNLLVLARVEGEGDELRLSTGLRHNLYGMWVPFLTTGTTCLLGALIGAYALPALLAAGPASLPRGLSMAWAGLLVVGAASAARTARTDRAFVWAAIAAATSAGIQAAGLLGLR
jgi:PTS system mannose-specific IIC component